MHLATVIDAHSRRVIGCAIADHIRTDVIEDAFTMAIVLRGDRPSTVILHNDRGTQYASEQITLFAANICITRSMGYTGTCWDNAMAGCFFATLKTEFYYRSVWPIRARASRGVADWIEDRSNRRRRHSSIGHVTRWTSRCNTRHSPQRSNAPLTPSPLSGVKVTTTQRDATLTRAKPVLSAAIPLELGE